MQSPIRRIPLSTLQQKANGWIVQAGSARHGMIVISAYTVNTSTVKYICTKVEIPVVPVYGNLVVDNIYATTEDLHCWNEYIANIGN